MGKRSPILAALLFASVLTVYLANGRTIGSGDTLPTRYLAWSLLSEGNADLDEFPWLYDEAALRAYPLLDGVPYFLHHRDGHFLSAYSAGPALLALPVYAGPVLRRLPAREWAPALEKLAASAVTALSVLLLLWALDGLVSRGWAVAIAVVYALGTSSWSVSSQALWQHGPSQLCVALMLACLVRGMRDERWLPWAGFAAGAATVMRSTDVLLAAPVLAWVVYTRRHLAWRLVLCTVPPLAVVGFYNVWCFGSARGPAGNTTAPLWAFFTQTPLLEGVGGLVLSPARGLLVYSPVLLFAVVGLAWAIVRGPAMLRALALGVVLVVLVVGRWFRWWGGYTWGPRLLADTLPVLCFFLYPLTEILDRRRLAKAAFVALAVVSIGIHALGALVYDGRWDLSADVDHHPAALWSWRAGPIALYAGELASTAARSVSAGPASQPTSADSPDLLAASYRVEPVASEVLVGERLAVSVAATNRGRATWLALAPGDRGAVRLGWRWSRDGVEAEGGRALLRLDVLPGETVTFAERVPVPAAPGDYTLTLDLVSELVTWFAGRGARPATFAVRVRPVDLDRVLSAPLAADAPSRTATIAADRPAYGRGDPVRLTIRLVNPHRPGQFDGYIIGQGPQGALWFYDGRRTFRFEEHGWVAWSRRLPMPARVTGHFTLPPGTLAPGNHRWYVVLTDAGTYRPLARGGTAFSVGP